MILLNVVQTFFLLVFLILFWSVLGIAFTQVHRKFLKSSENSTPYDLSTTLALGMTAWFCLASCFLFVGYFKFWTFAFIFVLSIWVSKNEIKNYWQSWFQRWNSFANLLTHTTKWENTLIVFIVIFIVLSMVAFVSPLESDGVAYYLPIAKLWADSGLIQLLRGYDDFSAVGAFAEIQMATVFLLDGQFLARGFSALLPLLICIELFKFSQKLNLSLQAYLMQVLALYTSICVVLIMYSGKIDLFSAWLGLLAIYCLFYDTRVFKAGLFLGAACLAKLTLLVPLFFVTLVALVYRTTQSHFLKINWRQFFILGLKLLGPFLFVIFWQLLKNQIIFENPLAPFFGNRIGEEKYWYAPETISRIKMLYPLVWFYGDFWGQLGSFSILVLMFLPLAWPGYIAGRALNHPSIVVVPYWISMFLIGMLFWFLIRPSFVAPRYIMGFFLITFPLMGVGYDWFINKNSKLKNGIVRTIIVLFSIHSIMMYLRLPISPLRAYGAMQTPLSKCKLDGPDCVAMELLNETAEPGSRTLQLMYESYWLRPDLIQTLMGFRELDGIENLQPEEKWKKIIARKFNYVILKASTHHKWVEKVGLSEVPTWVDLKQIFNFQGVAVWKIEFHQNHPDAPKIDPEIELKNTHNGWIIRELSSIDK